MPNFDSELEKLEKDTEVLEEEMNVILQQMSDLKDKVYVHQKGESKA